MKVAVYVFTGLVAGVFSGAMGVGGAIVATPLLRLAGISPYLAVGTTVPAILPGALTGAWTYMRAKFVDVRTVLLVGTPGAVFSFLGARATRAVNGHVLMILTAGVLAVLSFRLARQSAPEVPPEDGGRQGGMPAFGLLGAAAGFGSGLLGIGGGSLLVPVLSRAFSFPIKMALGTSLAIISIMALPNIIGQAEVGNINWNAALLLGAGIIPGARVGSLLALKAPDRTVKLVVGATLGAVAVLYAAIETAALGSS